MTPPAPARGATMRRVFGIPLLLGLLSAVGLLSALLGDHLWDALSWLTLSLPVSVILWYWGHPARS
jgi:hypothetical protein